MLAEASPPLGQFPRAPAGRCHPVPVDQHVAERPVFVVGMRRSGTTLMRSIIGAHPSIAMPDNESNYVTLTSGMRLDGSVEEFDQVWSTLIDTPFARNLGVDLETIRDRLRRPGVDHGEVFSGLVRELAKKEGKPRWGDKSPDNERHLDTLWAWYPGAQVVFMVRDPRAVIASLFSVPWQNVVLRRLVDGFAESWRHSARLATMADADERATVVRYEDLVRSPEVEVRRVCAFLDEPYVPEMLQPRGRPAPTGPDRSSDGMVTDASVDRWRAVLSRRETAVIEHVTRREMLEHGYTPDTSPAGPVLAAQVAAMRTARKAMRFARRAAS